MTTDAKTLTGAAIGAKVTIAGHAQDRFVAQQPSREHTGIVTEVRHYPGCSFVSMRPVSLIGEITIVSCPWP